MGGGVCVRRGGGVSACERRGCKWEEGCEYKYQNI